MDGPFSIDPDYFTSNNYTYTKVVDGITISVGIASDKTREWWTDSAKRSAKVFIFRYNNINSYNLYLWSGNGHC